MRILRFHKLMSALVFVIMQVPYVNLELKWRLFRSDSMVAFLNLFTCRFVSMSVIISSYFFTGQIAITFGSLVDSLAVSSLWMQECRTQERLYRQLLGFRVNRINERSKENNSLWYSNRVQLIVCLIVTPPSPNESVFVFICLINKSINKQYKWRNNASKK